MKKPKRSRDTNVLAYQIVQESVGETPKKETSQEPEKDPAVIALWLQGKKGGKARAAKMAPEERSEAARARWQKSKIPA